jgi:PTH1 family peptidyl-tRNA hydrolase
MALDELARRISAPFKSQKTNATVAEGRLPGQGPRLILAKPNTYMNVSGGPVAALLRFYKLDAANLIVLHDELDIPFDTIKLKIGGGHGGHNGVRDIAAAIGSPEFVRVRIGIGRPPGRQPAADFVLKDFSSDEKKTLPNLVSDAADAVEQVTRESLTAAQLRFHTAASGD